MATKKQTPDPNLSDSNKSFQERIDDIRSLVEENLRYTKSLKQSGQASGIKAQKDLQKLLVENLKISKDLYEMTKKINRWIIWQRVWGALKILIIVVPIILGIIYLPPLMQELIKPYQELLNLGQNVGPAGQNINNQALINQLLEQFKSNSPNVQ